MLPQYMEKHKKIILSVLAVFLLVIFGVPFVPRGARRTSSQSDDASVALRYKGKKVTWGEVRDTWARWLRCRFESDRNYSDQAAQEKVLMLLVARDLGLDVSDEEAIAFVKGVRFRRVCQVEYVMASYSSFESKVKVSDKEVQEYLAKNKDKSKEQATEELKKAKAREQATRAIRSAQNYLTTPRVGDDLLNAFKVAATSYELTHEQPEGFYEDGKNVPPVLSAIPGFVQAAFAEKVGKPSEIIDVPEGKLIYRIVLRTSGFDPDGEYHATSEGWRGQAFGVVDEADFAKHLETRYNTDERSYLKTVKELLLLSKLERLTRALGAVVPEELARERYLRDNEEMTAKYVALQSADFAGQVKVDQTELKAFYDEYKGKEPSPAERGAEPGPGYLVPSKVRFECVFAEKAAIEAKAKETPVTDAEIQAYYEGHRSDLPDRPLEEMKDEIEKKVVEERIIQGYAILSDASSEVEENLRRSRFPDMRGIAERLGLQYKMIGPVTKDELPTQARELTEHEGSEPSSLVEDLFDEKRLASEGENSLSTIYDCKTGKFFVRIVERTPQHQVSFEDLDAGTLKKVERDFRLQKGFELARQKADEIRVESVKAALALLGERLSAEAVDVQPFAESSPPDSLKAAPKFLKAIFGLNPPALSDSIEDGGTWRIGLVTKKDLENRITLRLLAFQAKQVSYQPVISDEEASNYYEDHFETDYKDFVLYPPLEEVKSEVEKALKEKKARAALRDTVQKAHAEAVKGGNPDALVRAYSLTRRTVAVPSEPPDAVTRVAGFSDALASLKPGSWSSVLVGSQASFFFKLLDRSDKTSRLDLFEARLESEKQKVSDAELKDFYRESRELYARLDENDARQFSKIGKTAQDKVKADILAAYRKLPLLDQLRELRTRSVAEAFAKTVESTRLSSSYKANTRLTMSPSFQADQEEIPGLGKVAKLGAAALGAREGELLRPITLKERSSVLLARIHERSDATYVELESVQFPIPASTPGPVAEAELQREYDAYKEFYEVPDTIQVEYLALPHAPLREKQRAQVKEEEIKAYYEEHKSEYTVGGEVRPFDSLRGVILDILTVQRSDKEARAVLEKVLAKAKDTPAADLAKEFSLKHDKSGFFSARDGALLPSIGSGELFAKASAAEPGSFVGPLRGSEAWFIAKLVDRKPKHIPPLSEIKDALSRAVRAREDAEAFWKKASSATLAAAAKDANLSVRPSSRFELEMGVPVLGKSPDLPKALDGAKEGQLLKPLRFADSYVVAVVKKLQHIPRLTIQYLDLNAYQFRTRDESVTDEEIKRYFDKHHSDYAVGETVKLKYLFADPQKLAKDISIRDEDARAMYDKEVQQKGIRYRDYQKSKPDSPVYRPFEEVKNAIVNDLKRERAREVALEKAKQAADKLAKSDFATVAKELDLDVVETEFFDAKTTSLAALGYCPEVVSKAFQHKKEGLTGAILAGKGALVGQVIATRPPGVPPLEEIKDKVKSDLLTARALEAAEQKARWLYDTIAAACKGTGKQAGKGKGQTGTPPILTAEEFQRLVDENPIEVPRIVSLRVVTTEFFRRPSFGYAMVPGLQGSASNFAETAFSLKPGDISPPVSETHRIDACYLIMRDRVREATVDPDALKRQQEMVRYFQQAEFLRAWRDSIRQQATYVSRPSGTPKVQ